MAKASREGEAKLEKQRSVQCVINANITLDTKQESFQEDRVELCGRHGDKSCGNGRRRVTVRRRI